MNYYRIFAICRANNTTTARSTKLFPFFCHIMLNVGLIYHHFQTSNAYHAKMVSMMKQIFGQGFSDTESFVLKKKNVGGLDGL